MLIQNIFSQCPGDIQMLCRPGIELILGELLNQPGLPYGVFR